MALPFRTRTVPQCTACLRSYALSETAKSSSPAWRQQIRGKKSKANATGTLPVRLLKDFPGFGKKGAYIPVTAGEMRNKFFPRRIAEYVTIPELKILRANNIPIQRDYSFGQEQPVSNFELAGPETIQHEQLTEEEAAALARAQKKMLGPEQPSPERSIELLEIFVNPVLEFYRPPIVEEKAPEEPKPEAKRERQRTASSAAADLLAARSQAPLERAKPKGPQAIYGSVSLADIVVHIRAAIAQHEEAARVLVKESDIELVDEELREKGLIKHVGDFSIAINVKGAPTAVKRTVRVIPQEA